MDDLLPQYPYSSSRSRRLSRADTYLENARRPSICLSHECDQQFGVGLHWCEDASSAILRRQRACARFVRENKAHCRPSRPLRARPQAIRVHFLHYTAYPQVMLWLLSAGQVTTNHHRVVGTKPIAVQSALPQFPSISMRAWQSNSLGRCVHAPRRRCAARSKH